MFNKLQFAPALGFTAKYGTPERTLDKKLFLFNSPLVKIKTTEKVDSFARTGNSLIKEESDPFNQSKLATKLAKRLATIQNINGTPDDVKMHALNAAYTFEKSRADKLEEHLLEIA